MSCKGSTALGNAFRLVFFSVGKITPGITYKRSITTITKNSDRSPISVGSRSIVLIRWTATPGKMLDIIENIRHVVFILELLSLPEEVHFATDDWLTKKNLAARLSAVWPIFNLVGSCISVNGGSGKTWRVQNANDKRLQFLTNKFLASAFLSTNILLSKFWPILIEVEPEPC